MNLKYLDCWRFKTQKQQGKKAGVFVSTFSSSLLKKDNVFIL